MKNKTNKTAQKNTTPKSKTTNGIRKIYSTGSYLVEKQINGVRYNGTFKKRKDAIKFKILLNNEAAKLKTVK